MAFIQQSRFQRPKPKTKGLRQRPKIGDTVMTDQAEKLLVSIEDGIKRITINRPERRNSVDRETVQLLREAIKQSAEDDTRVVILTGAGHSFCAGADLAATNASDIANYDEIGR